MKLNECLKIARQNAFLTQGEFAEAINVSACTVNRWENGKSKPNHTDIRNVKAFCETNNIAFEEIKSAWISSMEAAK